MKFAASSNRQPNQSAASWFARPPRIGALSLILIVITVCAFLPVLHNGFINFDDEDYVVANRHVQAGLTLQSVKWAFTTGAASNWHPVTWLSHMLDCQIYGVKPWGHHLTSLVLHTINVLLVFFVFVRMTGAVWRSFFVAAIFGIHPLRVESVAWVAERKDVLGTLFWMLTIFAYVRYAREFKLRGSRFKVHYLLALLCFALGLMSKPVLVTLPFALLLLDYWPLVRSAELEREAVPQKFPWTKLVLEKVPFFILAAAASVVTFLVQKHGGAVAALSKVSLGTRIENTFVAYARYLGKMFWPVDLSVFYTLPGHWLAGTVAISALLLAGISAVAALGWRNRPYLAVGWLWFLGTLVPMVGLVQVGQQSMADRYTYIPGIGVLIMIAWSIPELSSLVSRRVMAGAVSAVLVALCAVTREQAGQWKTSETLFRHALAISDDSFGARIDLGNYLASQGRLDEAIIEFQKAVQLQPDTVLGRDRLAAALRDKGRLDEAIQQFEEILKLNPKDADTENEIGAILMDQGHLDDAIERYRKAIAIDPNSAATHFNWGIALCFQGRYADAVGQLQQAVALQPSHARAHYNLGIAFLHTNRADDAIREFNTALSLEPNAKIHYHLGLALEQAGRRENAITQFRAALSQQPKYPEAEQELKRLSPTQ